jgi:hypothetical protein
MSGNMNIPMLIGRGTRKQEIYSLEYVKQKRYVMKYSPCVHTLNNSFREGQRCYCIFMLQQFTLRSFHLEVNIL